MSSIKRDIKKEARPCAGPPNLFAEENRRGAAGQVGEDEGEEGLTGKPTGRTRNIACSFLYVLPTIRQVEYFGSPMSCQSQEQTAV